MGTFNLKDNKWAFIEILGYTDDVNNAIQALKNAKLLHGNLSSNEEKGNKRFVQFYICHKNVSVLTQEEEEQYNDIANLYQVNIEYTFMGSNCLHFPNSEGNDFSIKYWEWWMVD